jgi:hypothetical protein
MIYIQTIYTYVQDALQTRGTDMTKLVTVETTFYMYLELMQFYSLGQPTMLGFLTRLFTVPEGLWLNYYFYYSKSLFSASMHCTPSTISNTTLTSIDKKNNATTAVLRNTGVLGKILIC